ncbi:uncharacterized protein LOC112182986 [Rosa chinensis]|uniref:uncharacterized protein LOC112182986 n=1 Tax=Rosa chinensis TaxID=74649 RepID=UPI001AD8DC58|nr:uncharacterized protein LOC112182986 [Rosa chinensis]
MICSLRNQFPLSFRNLYNGAEGLHTKVTKFVRDKDCVVCGPGVLIELDNSVTLQKGILEQQGDKTCGFWIMHYMKDIVEDKNQEWSAKWDRKGSNMYTQNDIDKVRAEWAPNGAQFQES